MEWMKHIQTSRLKYFRKQKSFTRARKTVWCPVLILHFVQVQLDISPVNTLTLNTFIKLILMYMYCVMDKDEINGHVHSATSAMNKHKERKQQVIGMHGLHASWNCYRSTVCTYRLISVMADKAKRISIWTDSESTERPPGVSLDSRCYSIPAQSRTFCLSPDCWRLSTIPPTWEIYAKHH